MSKRLEVIYLGKTLGTASGWDGDPGNWICFDHFEPAKGIELPRCDLVINEDKALIEATDTEGTVLESWTIEWSFKPLPKA